MKARPHIAIFIDYSIRIPNFKNTFSNFKSYLFEDNSSYTFEDEVLNDDARFFWFNELKKPEVEKFYISKTPDKINDTEIKGSFKDYFFNEEHLKKFLIEYSFNLYSDCVIPSKQDIEYINICQSKLFDVTLIDRYESVRKIQNTFFFLSTSRIYPRNVIFLGPGQEINKDNFVGIWDPMSNKDQVNNLSSTKFLEWLQELEKKYK